MAFIWTTRTIDPLPIGGAARFQAKIDGATSVLVVVGTSTVLNPDSLPLDSVALPLQSGTRGWAGTIWGAHAATKVSWFAKTGSGPWTVGPVDAITLPFNYEAEFPLPVGWIVDRISDYAIGCPPLHSREFAISQAYPRDTAGWPMASVQVDDISTSSQVIHNLLNGRMVGGKRQVGSAYNVTFSVVCWCATPEDRRAITPWLAGALEALRHCALVHPDLYEPSFTLSESEDFQTLGVPAFLATARFSTTVWSSLLIPETPPIGLVTVL